VEIIGLGIDHGLICTNYNTVYLDRDNTDPATVGCMRRVLAFYEKLFEQMVEAFGYECYRFGQLQTAPFKEMISKRFLFYSLEKEITMQTFILQKKASSYIDIEAWSKTPDNSLLIQNDEEGEGIFFYCQENSAVHRWLNENLKSYSVDEMSIEDIKR
jgi:hypothetical protein